MDYGFYDRLTEEFPSQIIVDLEQRCNYECIHCPHSMFKKSEIFSNSSLSVELNKKLVDEVAEFGFGYTQQIRYSGNGEPFIHPNIMEILEYAIKNSKTMVTITTNGSLLTKEKIDKLLDLELGLIDFSVDAFYDETYSEIRRKGKLDIVRKNILYMLKQKKVKNSKTKIIVSFVEQEKNKEEKDKFKEFWEHEGADFVVIRKLHSAGGAMYTKGNDKLKDIQPCVYPWERVVISAEGLIEFCPASWKGETNIGNYAETTIHEIWNSEKYKNLREEHINNKFSCYEVCGRCPDREFTIWPANKTKDIRGYGDMISDFSDSKELK